MKEKINKKLDERIDYILSKNVSDITNEEFEVLKQKLNKINIKENQNNNSDFWLLIIMVLFLNNTENNIGDDEDV